MVLAIHSEMINVCPILASFDFTCHSPDLKTIPILSFPGLRIPTMISILQLTALRGKRAFCNLCWGSCPVNG